MSPPTSRGGLSITLKIRHRAASAALLATIGLTGFKLGVAALSGSVGVLSEGLHSFLDLVSASLSFFTVQEAGKPADEDHPFGHGKIETLSSLFEALLLVGAAALMIYEGTLHIAHPHPLRFEWLAMLTLFISMIVSYGMYRHNSVAAAASESSALQVNALHFLSDVVAAAAVLLGLVVLKFTGWLLIDPLLGFGVAAYILIVSAKQIKRAILELSDTQLPAEEIRVIRECLDRYVARLPGKIMNAHDLRTRRSGATRHIDFHLEVCGLLSVKESHDICDEIEGELDHVVPGASITIHVEPCEQRDGPCEQRGNPCSASIKSIY